MSDVARFGGVEGESADESALPLHVLDPKINRAARKYTRSEQLRRVLWGVGQWLLRLSPRPFFAWRRVVLRAFGASIGKHVHVYPSTKIYMPWNLEVGDWAALGEDVFIYSLGRVSIGRAATVSYRAHVCAGTHDFDDPACPLLKPPVKIEEGAWIGTDAFIGPNVTIGSDAIVGARAVVVKSIAANHVVAGNPARTVRIRR
jgi:putative colanic acid biosynthesis acetyltransferase WcaF